MLQLGDAVAVDGPAMGSAIFKGEEGSALWASSGGTSCLGRLTGESRGDGCDLVSIDDDIPVLGLEGCSLRGDSVATVDERDGGVGDRILHGGVDAVGGKSLQGFVGPGGDEGIVE